MGKGISVCRKASPRIMAAVIATFRGSQAGLHRHHDPGVGGLVNSPPARRRIPADQDDVVRAVREFGMR